MPTHTATPVPVESRQGPSPLPALLGDVREIVLGRLHSRLAEEGFPGLRYKHGCVYRFIDDEGSRLTDLAERSGLTKQGDAEAVGEHEQLGYVERSEAPHDRRTKIIRLTERGQAGQRAAARVLAEVEQSWANRFGQDQIAAFRRTMEQIIGMSQE